MAAPDCWLYRSWVSIPTPPATPPGWYPNGPVQRYWDGTAWTDHTAPLPHAGPHASTGSSSSTYAVTTGPRPFNHVVHLILTICTCGFWLPFWIVFALSHAARRKKSVTRYR